MSGISQNMGQRLRLAQDILQKRKEKAVQSPNYTKVVINFRKQSLIQNIFCSKTQITSEPINELMAHNNVRMYEIQQILRKRLGLQQHESIQIFCRRKIVNDMTITVKELRDESNERPVQLQVVKMEVF